MTENKRYEYWKDSDTAYDTKIKYGQYFLIIDKKDMVNLLNKQDKQLQPFIELAKELDKTLEELYQFIRSYLNSRNENMYWNPK